MDNTIAKLLDLFKHISRDIMIYAISGFVVIVNFFIIDKFYLGGIYFVLIEKLEYISLIIFILSYVIGHVIMALTNLILNFKKIFDCNKTKLNIHKFEKEFEFEVKIFNKNQNMYDYFIERQNQLFYFRLTLSGAFFISALINIYFKFIKEIEISWYIILILIIIGVFLFCAYRLSQQRYYQKLKILKKYKSAYLKYPQRK